MRNCKNLSIINKVIKMTAIKYKHDKGRQERAMCLILSFIFSPNLANANEKTLFNATLKEIFDFDATNFIEEMLSNLLKDQISEDGLRVDKKQLQKVIQYKINKKIFIFIQYYQLSKSFIFKMIDLYTGLRINQSVIICGSPLEGKSTIWKTISRAMNTLQFKENQSVKKF